MARSSGEVVHTFLPKMQFAKCILFLTIGPFSMRLTTLSSKEASLLFSSCSQLRLTRMLQPYDGIDHQPLSNFENAFLTYRESTIKSISIPQNFWNAISKFVEARSSFLSIDSNICVIWDHEFFKIIFKMTHDKEVVECVTFILLKRRLWF